MPSALWTQAFNQGKTAKAAPTAAPAPATTAATAADYSPAAMAAAYNARHATQGGLGTLLQQPQTTAPTSATPAAASTTPPAAAAPLPGSLPQSEAASQALRDLQLGNVTGLQTLLGQDTTEARKRYEDAFYSGQEEAINTAADRARQALVEGTFARGVGPSSITVELAGRNQQEQSDALARAKREAITAAGSEDRADLASRLGLLSTGLAGATTGLQGEANVNLANLARQQEASQFGKNLSLQYSQLGQQASQFSQNLAFQGSENAANRELTATQAEANRQAAQASQSSSQTFTAAENALTRLATAQSQGSAQDFQAAQNDANRALTELLATENQKAAAGLQTSSQEFQAAQNDANRALTQLLATQSQAATTGSQDSAQAFQAAQNEANRALTQLLATQSQDAQRENLVLTLANQRDIASGQQVAGGIAAAGTGLGSLLGPALNRILMGNV